MSRDFIYAITVALISVFSAAFLPTRVLAGGEMVSGIVVDPPDAITLKEVRSLTGIEEGMPYSKKALKEGIKLLYLKGRFSDITVDAHGDKENVILTFRFVLREKIGEIAISGNKEISRRRLREVISMEEWDDLDLQVIERQVLALREYYHKRGYLRCEVEYNIARSGGGRAAGVEFKVREGQRAALSEIKFAGNRAFHDTVLSKKASVKKGDLYEEKNLNNAVKRVQKFYAKEDFPNVRVFSQSKHDPDRNEVEVLFNIEEGEQSSKEIRIEKIEFAGNGSIPSRTLRKQMLTGRYFSEEVFASDLDAIEYLYRKNGYLGARVVEKRTRFSDDGRKISIWLVIDEGVRTIIKEVDISGNRIFDRSALLGVFGLKTGGTLDPWTIEDGMARLARLYRREGHIYSKLSHLDEFSGDLGFVTIRIVIEEGIPVRIGKIIIGGNEFTDDGVIRRELLVKPGDVYDPERIFKSQQRVYRLGYLSNVRMAPVDEDEVEEEKDVLLSVKEKKAGAVEFGLGYGTEEHFRGFAEVSHKNIYGTGMSARLRGDVSQLESMYVLGFKKPWLLDLPVDGRFSLVDQVMRRDSYSLEKRAAIAGFDKDITETLKASLQYEYEISRVFDVEEGAKVAPEDEGTTDIGTVSPMIIRDSRDNPFNPKKGSVNSLKIDYSAGMATGSEVEFIRYTVQSSWYVPVAERVVWGVSLRGGWAEAQGDTEEIPISKRFFLGGRTTVRGFDLDSIGPKGVDGSATGGDASVNLNTELRFPVYRNFGGLLFVDAGNIWLRSDESVNVFDLRSAAGAGMRYLTPIGPLSLDAGWKLDREKGESAWEWHFTIGNVF